MKPLRIYTDLAMEPEAYELLSTSLEGHELLLPETPAASVLSSGGPDPRLLEADIAFGQPDPDGVANAPDLKFIQITSSGITRYDKPDFRKTVGEHEIPVCNSAGVYDEHCAVQTLAFMLARARSLPRSLSSEAEPGSEEWNHLRASMIDLRRQKVVIVGFGAIGRRLVDLLEPFDMDVHACRRSARGDEKVPVISPEKLSELLPSCDHVVNILPESDETRDLFDAALFQQCKLGASFYNIGRGPTVDQEALGDALRSGHLAAAWLDVTDPEPLPSNHPLRVAPNCHITPHVAGGHRLETVSLVRHFLENLKRFTNGDPLIDRVM